MTLLEAKNNKPRICHFGHVVLSPVETMFNWLVWMPLSLLPFYLGYKMSVELRAEFIKLYELTPGWLGYKKDSNDYEWHYWQLYTKQFFLLFLSNSIIIFLTKMKYPKYLKEIMILTALALHSFALSWRGVMVIACQIVFFYGVTLLRSKLCMWLGVVLMIYSVNNLSARMFIKSLMSLEDEPYEIVALAFMMSTLRLVSYGCHVLDQHSTGIQNQNSEEAQQKNREGHQNPHNGEKKIDNYAENEKNRLNNVEQNYYHCGKEQHNLIACLSYILYVPVFYNGPVITYDIFDRDMRKCVSIHKPDDKSADGAVTRGISSVAATTALVENLPEVMKDFSKCVLQYFCFEIFLHFIYMDALSRNQWMLESMSSLNVIGITWICLHIFNIKYYIFYRFTGLFAKLDGIVPPGPPKCIASLYTFVDMWRYFDKGLYRLLQQCIYFPLGGSKAGLPRQVIASFFCFSFVGFWHGGSQSLMFWALTNWMGIVAETIVARLVKARALKQRIGLAMYRRLCALGGSMSVFALIYTNMVFLIGYEGSSILLKRVFISWYPPMLILIVLYFANQCSIDVN